MSTAWTEDFGTEYDEYDDAELYDDSEAYDDAEASKAERRRKARQIAARRQAAQRRAGRNLPVAAPTRPNPQQVVSAVRNLEVDSKVAQDDLRKTIAALKKREGQADWVSVLTVLVNQGLRTFGAPDNPALLAGIAASPLLFLPQDRRGSGVGSLLADKRLIGIGGAVGLGFFAAQRDRKASVERIEISGPDSLVIGDQDVFVADVLDGKGRPVTTTITWASSSPDVAAIEATTGVVTAGPKTGTAVITVSVADGITRHARVKVVAPVAQVAAAGRPDSKAPAKATK
jgi:hypothetical protein